MKRSSVYPFNGISSYHLYVVLIDFPKAGTSREELFHKMRERGIGLQVHYIPINKQPYYRNLGYGSEATPMMDSYYEKCVSLPLYPGLEEKMQEYVIDTLTEFIGE